jgi:hypothetical protein
MTITATAPARTINGAAVPSVQSKATTHAARKTTPARKRPTPLAKREANARRTMRVVGIVGAAIVWINALWISYFHIAELTIRHGQSAATGHMFPLIVDGLMLVSSVATVAQRQAKLPKITFMIGASATIGANLLSVTHADIIGYTIAGFTGVSLILSAVILERLCLPQAPKRRKPAARKTR